MSLFGDRSTDRRLGNAAIWAGGLLMLAGASAAAVLAWTNRFQGWVLLPITVVSCSGAAIALAARRRLARRADHGGQRHPDAA